MTNSTRWLCTIACLGQVFEALAIAAGKATVIPLPDLSGWIFAVVWLVVIYWIWSERDA